MKDIKEMNFIETVKDLPNRITTLIWKMLSIKFAGLAFSGWLVWTGKITGWYAVVLLLVTFLIVVFGREAIKWLEILKDLKG